MSSALHAEVGTGPRAPLLAAGSEPSTQLYFIFGSSRFICCPSFFLVHLSSLSSSPTFLAEAGLCSCPGTEQRGAGGSGEQKPWGWLLGMEESRGLLRVTRHANLGLSNLTSVPQPAQL